SLERLYRSDKSGFRKAFTEVYPDYASSPLARAWKLRLTEDRSEIDWGTRQEFMLVAILSLAAGSIAKLPDWFGLDEERYFSRNAGFIIFPLLTAFFLSRKGAGTRAWIALALATLVPVVYMNVLPLAKDSNTLILACIHSALMMWSLTGFGFCKFQMNDLEGRIKFLRFNGDFLIIGAVLGAGVGVLAGITFALFNLIGINIQEVFAQNILVYELTAIPFVASWMVLSNPQLVDKVSPLVARMFSPIVLVTLSVYLVAILVSGKDPYNDREFLLNFNLLLIGVMAIILFSIAGTSGGEVRRWEQVVLWLLSVVTIVVNFIAVSAILFRISEWGITPNRAAVLGSNLLILANMIQLTFLLFQLLRGKSDRRSVEQSIARFLPVYAAWTIVVVFLFPVLFQ
ncbi:MAG: hypothetical protein ACKO3B_09650, partial [Bacteroidota bacterium]